MLVQYKSTIINNVEVILINFKEHYKYRIKSGPINDDLKKNDMNKFSTYHQFSQNKYNVSSCDLKKW